MAAIEQNLSPSTTVMYTDRRDFYIKPDVVKNNYTIVTPFLTSVANWNQILYPKDPQFKMFEYQVPWIKQYFQVTTGTTVDVDNAEDTLAVTVTGAVGMPSAFTNHLLGLKLAVHANVGGKPSGASKGEVIVTTFTSTTSINVKGIGVFGDQFVVANDDWLVVIGTGFGEGTEAANPSSDDIQVVWNQCGIHKTSFQLTNTLMQASLRGESKEYDRRKLLKAQEHQVQKERDMLFSTSAIGTNLAHGDTFADGKITDAAGNTIRTTYGVFAAVLNYGITDVTDDNQNIFDINSASYSYSNWVDDSEKFFEYNPEGTIPVYSSNKLISFLNKLEGTGGQGIAAKSRWTINMGFPAMSKSQPGKLGFNYRELESPHGTYQFVKTPTITKSPYNGYGLAPDPANIFHVVYRKPMYQQIIKTDNAPDYQKNQYMSDEGMGISNLTNHKMLRLV